jgi:hypothetical protein
MILIYFIQYRCLRRYKGYMCNKAEPEGSIAEGYVAEEILNFCSRYLESLQTVFNRPLRNPDDGFMHIYSSTLMISFHFTRELYFFICTL